jgi:hypothetical protein
MIIEHREGEETYAIGVFLTENREGSKVLYSGGRFGFLGFENLSEDTCTEDCVKNLIQDLGDFNFDAVSIRWDSLGARSQNDSILSTSDGSVISLFDKEYYVTKLSETIEDQKLIFPESRIRNNLTRNLNKSKKIGFDIIATKNLEWLMKWFTECHQVRMTELNSRGWDLKFFQELMATENSVLFVVSLNREIVGGSFCISSETELEIIMMSTPQKYLNLSVNYFLTNEIYKWSELKGLNTVNWQASNPPQGGVAQFKRSWNAKTEKVSIYSSRNSNVTDQSIKRNFPDRFIHPFQAGVSE